MTTSRSSTDGLQGSANQTQAVLKSSLKPSNKCFPSKPIHPSPSLLDSDEEDDGDLRSTLISASYKSYSDEEDGDCTDSDYSDASVETLPSFDQGPDCNHGDISQSMIPDISSESVSHSDTLNDTRPRIISKCLFVSCNNAQDVEDIFDVGSDYLFDDDLCATEEDSALPDIASFPDRLPSRCMSDSEEEDDMDFGHILVSDEPPPSDKCSTKPTSRRGGLKPLHAVPATNEENIELPMSSSSPFSPFSDDDISQNDDSSSSPSPLPSDSSGVTPPTSTSQSPQSPTSSLPLYVMAQKCACTFNVYSSECKVLTESLGSLDLRSEHRDNSEVREA